MVTFQLKCGAQRPCSVPYKLFLHRRELCRQKSSITDAFETKLRLTNELIIDTIRKNNIHTMDDVNVLSREINYKNKLLEEAPRMQRLKQQKKAEKLQNMFVNGECKYQPANVRNAQADTSSHKRKRTETLIYKQPQVLEGHSNKITKKAQSYVKQNDIKTSASRELSGEIQYQQLSRTKSANESPITSQAFLSSSKNNQNNAQQQRAQSIEARCYEQKTCVQSTANSTQLADTHKPEQPQGTLHKITTRDRFKEQKQKHKKYGHHHTNTVTKPIQQLQRQQRMYAKCARSKSWETVENQQQQINATDFTRVSSTYDRKAYEATSNTTSVRFNGWRSYNHNLQTTQSADYQQLQRHQQISTNNLEDPRYSNKRKRHQFSKPLNRFDDDRFQA